MTLRAPRFVVDMAVAFQFLTACRSAGRVRARRPGARCEVLSLCRPGNGAGAALLQKLLSPHLSRPACALIVLLYLVLITGCIHEDGLADVADSLGGWNREQRLAILHDSRIGAFGAVALALSLLSRGVLLGELPLERFTAYLVSAHVLCRWSALPFSYYLPPARDSEGQGARIARLTSIFSLVAGSILPSSPWLLFCAKLRSLRCWQRLLFPC